MANVLDMHGFKDPLVDYASWNSLDVNENANRYIGPTGFFSYLLDKYMEIDALKLIPPHILKAHKDGIIYMHKLPYSVYIPYCTGHSIARLLRKGLRTITIVSRPARHFDTLVDHIANFLITMQHYFTGAQALSSVEWYAGPFIRNDKPDYKAIIQQVQRLLFNLNYPTRIGLQTPFTNFTITMDAPRKMLQGDKAIYAGEEMGPLGDYEEEAKIFLRALIENYLRGDAVGQPFTFPIPTLMTTSKWIWEDPEIHELVFKTAAKRGSFYWLNTRLVDPDAAFAMCCRISIDRKEFQYVINKNTVKYGLGPLRSDIEDLMENYWKLLERQRFGGLWAMPDITGSVNVVDVNLPRIALMSQKEESRFWEMYAETLKLVKESVEWFRNRYTHIMKNYPNFYAMILEYMPEFPAYHFNTIGLIGLPEAVAILIGEPRLWLDGARKDWLRAADLMRKIVEYSTNMARKWMMETGVPWNVEEVPGESASPKLAMTDLKLYPVLKEYLPDPENPVYSTSIAPYYAEIELPDRIEIEQRVQKYFTGGVMMHIFLGEEPDEESLVSLTKKLIQTDLVYWSYTPAITFCNTCSKTLTGLYTKCPMCGSENVDIWSRIIGYYRPLRNWNPQRKREFWKRYHYHF